MIKYGIGFILKYLFPIIIFAFLVFLLIVSGRWQIPLMCLLGVGVVVGFIALHELGKHLMGEDE